MKESGPKVKSMGKELTYSKTKISTLATMFVAFLKDKEFILGLIIASMKDNSKEE